MRGALLLYSEMANGPAFAGVDCDSVFRPVADDATHKLTEAALDAYRPYFKAVGIMRDPTWPWDPYSNPVSFAERFSQDFEDLASPSFGRNPKQCLGIADAERPQDSKWHLAWIKRFRQLRNLRRIWWTIEPGQGGWISVELAALINGDPNIQVIVQGYRGTMQPFDLSVARADLQRSGIRPEKITSFHGLRDQRGNKRLVPDWWDGFLYVENKLQNDTISY